MESNWRWNVEELGYGYGPYYLPPFGYLTWTLIANTITPVVWDGNLWERVLQLDWGGIKWPVLGEPIFGDPSQQVFYPPGYGMSFPYGADVEPD